MGTDTFESGHNDLQTSGVNYDHQKAAPGTGPKPLEQSIGKLCFHRIAYFLPRIIATGLLIFRAVFNMKYGISPCMRFMLAKLSEAVSDATK